MFFILIFISRQSVAQEYPASSVKYNIHADLDTETKIVTGIETIEITNVHNDELQYIWLHLIPNAYENDSTSYTRFSLNNKDTRFYFSDKEERANLTISEIKVDGESVNFYRDESNKEWVKVNLPHSLSAYQQATISVNYLLKLPRMFDESGYNADRIRLSNWYPVLTGLSEKDLNMKDYTSVRYTNHLPADYNITLNVDHKEINIKEINTENIVIDINLKTDEISHVKDSTDLNVGKNYWIKGAQINSEQKATALINSAFPKFFNGKLPVNASRFLLSVYEKADKGQPIVVNYPRTDLQSLLFEEIKSKLWFDSVRQIKGSQNVEQAFNQLKNNPETITIRSLQNAFASSVNNSLNSEFDLLYSEQSLYNNQKKSIKPAFLFNFKETDKYNYISVAPALGYNNYNSFMAGLLIHNYQLPYNKFNFLLAPMYATGNQDLAGLARVEYNLFKRNQWWQFAFNGSQFAYNTVNLESLAEPLNYTYKRFVPSAKLTLYRDDLNEKKWIFNLKDYIFNFSSYQLNSNPATSVIEATPVKINRNIAELNSIFKNDRVLYPYNIALQVNGSNDFLRAGITAKQFFNYDASGKGITARVFGGKFFYLVSQSFTAQYNTTPYHFYMAGTAVTDFTYSNYFVGRNEQQGWMSQQIAERDGFFKVYTPMRSEPVGTSDNWLASINLTADIPDKINPFARLPFKIPVKAFADIGTFSGAWNDDASTGKFVYDGGIQLSLLNEAVSVYFPLLYSKVYRDYYKSIYGNKYFGKTISFSINIENLKPKKLKTILPY